MWGLFSLVYETITAHWANICLDICLVLSLGRQYASLILGGGSLGCHVMRSGWALSRSSSTLTRAASKKNCQVQTKVVVKCLGWPVATCCSGNAHCYGQLQTMLLSNLWFSRLLLHFSYFSTALALSHFALSQLVDLSPLPAFVFSEYTRVIPASGSCCSQFELPGKFCCCLTG